MKPLGRPTILGFGNPSGSLEDGAREWEIYSSWSLQMFMGSPAKQSDALSILNKCGDGQLLQLD